jgi:prepilin-type N-terminal cleavage/methylation domain-containing protein
VKIKAISTEEQGFSLAELLVVLTIISILSFLAVQSVSSLRSTALSTAGNQLVDVFAMARQNSISKNDYTAVIIQTTGPGACSAYCLLELPTQPDGTRGTLWNELTPWRFLPKGVVFENHQANDTFMSTTLNSSATTPPTLPVSLPNSYSFQGSQINFITTPPVVQCYQPDGTLIGAQQSLALRLIEGTADTSGSTSNTGKANYYDIYFMANTGTTQIGCP